MLFSRASRPGWATSATYRSRVFCPLALLEQLVVLLVEAIGETMPSRSIDLPQGTLDLLILHILSLEPLHGWAVSERIQQISSKGIGSFTDHGKSTMPESLQGTRSLRSGVSDKLCL